MKASDVFRETQFLFAKKVSFKEAFPEIKKLEIRAKESGYGVYEEFDTKYYSIEHLAGEFIDCSNPLCYNGGFSVGKILREMVREKETHYGGLKICQGYEGSPKGRRRYRRCINSWEVTIDLEYYTDEELKKIREMQKTSEIKKGPENVV